MKETKQEEKERLVKRKKQSRNAREQGITLVALVITIIIIIILATVAINFALGDNGLIKTAEQARDYYANDTKYTEDSVANVEKYLEEMMPEGGEDTPEEPAEIPETESYVGYYADVDGNNTVDGIIYADLAVGGSGTGLGQSYTITKGSGFKKYKEEGTYSEDGFGSKGIIKPNGGNGNERFYVMALDDVDKQQNGTRYCWYDAAYGNMSDYSSQTSTEFGRGEQNTINMIAKWNGSLYGAQNDGSYDDMWGISAVNSRTWNESSGWYIPSRDEWAAFAGELGITNSNHSSRGLSIYYWSSSQVNASVAWGAYFSIGDFTHSNVDYGTYVRLGTTF